MWVNAKANLAVFLPVRMHTIQLIRNELDVAIPDIDVVELADVGT